MKYTRLICVTENNNNKFYEMLQTSDTAFTATYGRVGEKETKKVYPLKKWNSILNNKLKKGYVDVTEMQEVTKVTDAKLTGNYNIDDMLTYLLGTSKFAYNDVYSISGSNITQKQVDEGLLVLQEIYKNKTNISLMRELYIKLFTTIPRKMSNIKYFLPDTVERALELYELEYDNLNNANVQRQFVTTDDISLLDNLGVELTEVDINPELLNILQGNENRITNIFSFTKPDKREAFERYVHSRENKTTKLAWHGTSDKNILSIMNSSLYVRPSTIATGSMLGIAAYFSQEWQKSYNYTVGIRRFMFVFNIHTGNELVADTQSKIRKYTSEELEKGGYDSVWAPAKTHTGWAPLNYEERTIYKDCQINPAYIVEIN